MNKLSIQQEKELITFIKDWLKVHGFSQKDLATELNIHSSRTSEILSKVKELYKKGGIFKVAKTLIKIEQNWVSSKNNQYPEISYKEEIESKSYNQLDLNYKLDIDALIEQMEKDHNKN